MMRNWILVAASFAAVAAPPIDTKTTGLPKSPGFIPYYWDEAQGKIWLEIGSFGEELLYYSSLPAGLGSNDIGLDRGQLGPRHIVRFDRHGPKVFLVEPNLDYRAMSSDPAERRAVRESFAESVLWGFKVEAETAGRVLVDATDFFLRDAHGVAERLTRARQGAFRIDPSRSALVAAGIRNFPQNTEVEAVLTFTGGPAGPLLRAVTPSPDAVTLKLHHSFVELPPPGYEPREFDPRSGFNDVSFMDYAAPVGEAIVKRYVARHRPPKDRPIVYYLDRGAPEPVRSALLEGARWWSDAFAAAGFPNGFRVELMPEGADPMDIRYNVIQWVHRSTRGWSYGSSVIDPRTGEILKGHVTLGSLRVRQDFLIAEAFRAPYAAGAPPDPQPLQMSLDRLRQLSAHEVGHTLGLAHNYIASTRNRASVMDYPHPWIDLDAAGRPDLANSYAKGIGDWDKVSIRWGYGDNPGGVLEEAARRGLVFLTDQDARPPGSAHPEVHLWDSGASAVDELQRFMTVRARALERFGEANIRPGTPLATLHDTLVPLYLSHRYQLEAAAKTIGGLTYSYALRGDGQTPVALVDPAAQRRALEALLETVRPAALMLPDRVLNLIPPRPDGWRPSRELFASRTGLTFDEVIPAETAADLVFGLILHPERATRLVQFHSRDARQLSLDYVIERILTVTWRSPVPIGYAGLVQRTVNFVALTHLMRLSTSESASMPARSIARSGLMGLKPRLQASASPDARLALDLLAAAGRDPKSVPLPRVLDAPPGMPIGSACGED